MLGKILIVDDDRDIVSAIETILSMDDYELEHAYSGEESLRKARKMHPDLVLLDFMLPDMNGKDVVESFRNDPDLKDTPIILISAAHGLKDIAKHLPIQGLIEKPFELELLLSSVSQQISKS